jgi:ABC-type glycerol-3-phosphate transport system substrate-binding protein
MKNLQIGIMVLFGAFIVIAVLSFSGFIPVPGGDENKEMAGDLTLWGTDNTAEMSSFLGKIMTGLGSKITVKYTQKSSETFANDLIEALASGMGPDMIILPQELVVRLESKIAPFAPEVYSERDFKNAFIQNGEIFIRPKGIIALPISVDPMVMYWNRDTFTNKSIALPPKYWDEFLTLAPILTEKNETNDIKTSALAFGEFQNVTNAKEIVSTLILQSGNPLMVEVGSVLQPAISGLTSKNIPSIVPVLRFYTDFADPVKNIYSWNRALPESKESFLSGDLAVYFGFSTELLELREKNPNLNFDVASIPQIRDYPLRMTFGKTQGIAVLNASAQKDLAFYVAKYITTPNSTILFADINHKISSSREVLAKIPTDPIKKIFYDSTIISKSWLDPNSEKTSSIFKSVIENIISGRVTMEEAVGLMQAQFILVTPKGI